MKNIKILLLLLFGNLILDTLVMLYIAYQYHHIKEENKFLKQEISYLQNTIKKKSNNPEKEEKENSLNLKDSINIPPIEDEIKDPFEEMQKLEERMNKLFSQMDRDLSNKFEININPKSGSYFHFSNTQIINGEKFSYNIDVNNNKIKGEVTYKRKETLKQLQKKLEELGVKTKLDGNTLKFWGENIDVNKILNIFNIEFKENRINPQQPNKNGIKRF